MSSKQNINLPKYNASDQRVSSPSLPGVTFGRPTITTTAPVNQRPATTTISGTRNANHRPATTITSGRTRTNANTNNTNMNISKHQNRPSANNIQEYKLMGAQSMISSLIGATSIVTSIANTINNIITTVTNGLIYETKRHQQLKTIADSKTSIDVDETIIKDRKNKNNREEIESTEAHILSVHSNASNLTKSDGEYQGGYYQVYCQACCQACCQNDYEGGYFQDKYNRRSISKEIISLDTTDLKPIEIKVFENYENKNKLTIDSMSFSGGGYNCMYHMGVVKYIFENLNLFKDTKYLGASGGAGVIGMLLCFENDPERFTILNEAIEDVIGMKQLNLSLRDQVKVYSSNLMKHITRERFDRYIKNSNRCHISVTDVTGIVPYNTIKTNFSSYEQFIDTIKASACVPVVLDDRIRVVDNRSYLDGGLSNNLPCLDDKTIRISCLNYPLLVADIYPKIIFDMKHCFVPPDRNYILNMHDLGYNDIELYMRDKKSKLIAFEKESEFNKCITDIINNPAFISDKNVHPV